MLTTSAPTMGGMAIGFVLPLAGAGAGAARGFAQVPLALGDESQHCLVICIHQQALLGTEV